MCVFVILREIKSELRGKTNVAGFETKEINLIPLSLFITDRVTMAASPVMPSAPVN